MSRGQIEFPFKIDSAVHSYLRLVVAPITSRLLSLPLLAAAASSALFPALFGSLNQNWNQLFSRNNSDTVQPGFGVDVFPHIFT